MTAKKTPVTKANEARIEARKTTLGDAQIGLETATADFRKAMTTFAKAKEALEQAETTYDNARAVLTIKIGEVVAENKVLPLGAK
jgi:exonuclease VII small subunit